VNRAPRILEARARAPGPPFRTPAAATTWFHLRVSELPCEVVAVAWLDINLRLIEFREIFRGTVTGCDGALARGGDDGAGVQCRLGDLCA
jgi:DNA repair protein RadC